MWERRNNFCKIANRINIKVFVNLGISSNVACLFKDLPSISVWMPKVLSFSSLKVDEGVAIVVEMESKETLPTAQEP